MPNVLTGNGVSPGRAAAEVFHLAPPVSLPEPAVVTDPDADRAAARSALASVASDLRTRAENANSSAARDVLQAQALMADDPFLAEGIDDKIEAGTSAPYAIRDTFAEHREAFLAAGGVMAERVSDLDDLSHRAVAAVLGTNPPGIPQPGRPFILAARDLSPADTATLDPEQVKGIVTANGGPTSHTAILARALGIPAVVGCRGITDTPDGALIGVDGDVGEVTLGISDLEVEQFNQATGQDLNDPGGPGRTADGAAVPLLINIGSARDVPSNGDFEGVGLFRTELLYLHRQSAPNADEQVRLYQEAFSAVGNQTLVVRTLDAGADKPLPFLNQEVEPNPALGVRGLRLVRTQPEVVREQLQALAKAADLSGVHPDVMAPMVSTPQEAAEFAQMARSAGLKSVGVMIEVPSAAVMAKEILHQVDFLSIGTNDLSQYAFAADRENAHLADLLDVHQTALLRLIAMCGQAGVATGKRVGVCGEAAADPKLAPILVGLGITSLSMSPSAIPAVRASLSRLTSAECAALAQQALGTIQ